MDRWYLHRAIRLLFSGTLSIYPRCQMLRAALCPLGSAAGSTRSRCAGRFMNKNSFSQSERILKQSTPRWVWNGRFQPTAFYVFSKLFPGPCGYAFVLCLKQCEQRHPLNPILCLLFLFIFFRTQCWEQRGVILSPPTFRGFIFPPRHINCTVELLHCAPWLMIGHLCMWRCGGVWVVGWFLLKSQSLCRMSVLLLDSM